MGAAPPGFLGLAAVPLYYCTHAATYADATWGADVGELYRSFLARVPEGGQILDAGCGSGRDAATFIKRGYSVTAFDGSGPMAEEAARRTGISVARRTFADVDERSVYDGVWACASLVHLTPEAAGLALQKLVRALRAGGALFVSVKGRGDEDVDALGRPTTYWAESEFAGAVAESGARVIRVWTSPDPLRRGLRWVNVLAEKG